MCNHTHQPWNTELWGRGRSNNDGAAEPRRMLLVITNEGSIDLHQTHRFQTNLLYPVHLDYVPSDRGQTNRAIALVRDQILAWWCCLRISFIRGRWDPRSIPHLIHHHPHNPITLSLHVCGSRLSWHEQLFFCSWCSKNSEMGCVGANIVTQPILNCRKSFPTAYLTACSLFSRSIGSEHKALSGVRLAERVCKHLSRWTMIGEELGSLMQESSRLPPPVAFLSFWWNHSRTLTFPAKLLSPSQVLHQCLSLLSCSTLPWLKLLHPSICYALSNRQARRKLILSWLKRIVKLEYPWKTHDTCSSATFPLQCQLVIITTQPEPLNRYVVCHPLWDRDDDRQCSFGLAGHLLPRAKKT